jgi:pimeloyl-ACP methyl ester carboxylesterase
MNHRRFSRALCALFVAAASAFAAADEKQVVALQARHSAGQTMLTWQEVDSPVTDESIAAIALRDLRRDLDKQKKVRYRVYRSERPIKSVADLKPIAEVPPLTCWNIDYYGDLRPEHKALRYVIEEGKPPVPPGTGIYAHNPRQAGAAYYAVTVSIDGKENTSLGPGNATAAAVQETVGLGVPVLQRIEKPKEWHFVQNPTLHYYVRWESPPNCAVEGKPYDYVVGVPPKLAKPAPVGIHLHCWGGSLNGGYGWWYGAEQGHILVASNQIPYDWWTGYHELYWQGPAKKVTWQQGVVRPYSQLRMLSFVDWVATKWETDPSRTHVAGSSMGGSGAPMLAIRFPERIAWATSWVGVHNPARSPGFKGSYVNSYGPPEWEIKMPDGTPVWDYFNDAWYLRKHPEKEIGLICFSNGKNDGGIGWPQAQEFYAALRDTRRPHIFVWGQSGHGQRAQLPVSLSDRHMPMDLRTDQSLPAFTGCSLDDNPGNGEPGDGDPKGQVNLYLFWETNDVVDRPDRWEMTVGLIDKAPQDDCRVNVTPRSLQQLKLKPGQKVKWTNAALVDNKTMQSGTAAADDLGLITLEKVRVTKGKNRIRVER